MGESQLVKERGPNGDKLTAEGLKTQQEVQQQLVQLKEFTREPAVVVNGAFAHVAQSGDVYLAFHQSFHPQIPPVVRMALSMNAAEAGRVGQMLVDLAKNVADRTDKFTQVAPMSYTGPDEVADESDVP